MEKKCYMSVARIHLSKDREKFTYLKKKKVDESSDKHFLFRII